MNRLFQNSHEALLFAFNFSTAQYGVSEMARLAGPMASSGKGLVGVDGAGQAGMIMRKVDALDRFHRACIVARYSQRFEECKCCRNASMPLQQYREATGTLADWSAQFITGLSLRQLRVVIIRSFYEPGVSFKAEAENLNVPKSTAYDQRSMIIAGLKKIDSTAQAEIFASLDALCFA
jgi:hypothetical protein